MSKYARLGRVYNSASVGAGQGVGPNRDPAKRAGSADQADRLWRHGRVKIRGKWYPPGNAGEWRSGKPL